MSQKIRNKLLLKIFYGLVRKEIFQTNTSGFNLRKVQNLNQPKVAPYNCQKSNFENRVLLLFPQKRSLLMFLCFKKCYAKEIRFPKNFSETLRS